MKRPKRNNKPKFGGRKLKPLLLVSVVLIAGLAIGSTLFSGLVSHTDTVTTTYPITFDGVPCGELVTTDNVNGMAGESINTTHVLEYNATSTNGPFEFSFEFNSTSTVLTDGGIVVSLWWNNTDHTGDNLILSPGDCVTLTVVYDLHKLLIPDNYDITMSVDLVE